MRFTTFLLALTTLVVAAQASQIQTSSIHVEKIDEDIVPSDMRNLRTARQPTRRLRNRLRQLVNQERRKRGLKNLILSQDIDAKAQKWAEYMARTGDFRHGTLTDGVTSTWRRLGENIAYNYSIEGGHNSLMNSPGHRANILSPHYNTIGIGVVQRADGRIYICQVFMQKVF